MQRDAANLHWHERKEQQGLYGHCRKAHIVSLFVGFLLLFCFCCSAEVRLSSTVGVHPHDAKHYHADEISKLAERASIVGECGIDFDRMFSPTEVQKEAFISQLLLAKRLSKPVFLHQRLGFAEFNAIMDEHWPKGEREAFFFCCF